MEEVSNLSHDDVLELMSKFPVQPRRNRVIITLNTDIPDGNIVLSNQSFSEVQYVVAASENSADIVRGQKVLLDVEKMMVYEQADDNSHDRVGRVKIRPIEVDGITFGLINENVIEAFDNRV